MAEDFDERMAAVQRAYAEVILNTAKESAARVLVAERRVVQLEQSLSMAKEESLAVLLRVKAIMDSKIKEAEKVNLLQARKIQGLEDQLSEAKDTIDCLRSELERLNSEIERRNNNQAEDLCKQDARHDFSSQKDIFHENKHCSASAPCSDMRRNKAVNCLSNKSARRSVSLKNLTASDDCTSKPDFASIILRNKDTELYRNGCTQRIRAFEQNLLTNREPAAQSQQQHLKIESEAGTFENGKAERPSVEDSAMTDERLLQPMKPLESKENGRPGDIYGNGHAVRLNRRRLCRKRRARRRRVTRPLCFVISNGIADHDISENFCSNNVGIPAGPGDQTRPGEILHAAFREAPQTTVSSHLPQIHGGDSKTMKDENVNLINNQALGLSSINRIKTRRVDVKQCSAHTEKHIDSPPMPGIEDECQENSGKTQIRVSTVDMIADEDVKNDVLGPSTEEDLKLTADSCTIEENLDICVVKDLGPDMGNSRPSEPPAEAGSDRILKYTFRRKRKRGLFDKKDDFVSSEEKDLKRKVERENALVETQNHSSRVESSRDSRRLAQVARQLISLSEKRWW